MYNFKKFEPKTVRPRRGTIAPKDQPPVTVLKTSISVSALFADTFKEVFRDFDTQQTLTLLIESDPEHKAIRLTPNPRGYIFARKKGKDTDAYRFYVKLTADKVQSFGLPAGEYWPVKGEEHIYEWQEN